MASEMAEETRPRAQRRREKRGADGVAATIALRNSRSGRMKHVRVGFAWDVFLLGGVFGIPLFLRRLPQWGAAMLALWLADFMLVYGLHLRGGLWHAAQAVLFAAFLALQLWLGFKGNALTARALLAGGWSVQRPDEAQRRVLRRWGIEP